MPSLVTSAVVVRFDVIVLRGGEEVLGFDVVASDDSEDLVEPAVVFVVSEESSDVFEGVVEASVSVGVAVSSSDVVVVGGGSVVDSASDSLEDVGVVSGSVEVGRGSEVADDGSKSARPPEESPSTLSWRIDSTSTTLFLPATSGPPAFCTEEMWRASSDKTKEASKRAISDSLAGCREESMVLVSCDGSTCVQLCR